MKALKFALAAAVVLVLAGCSGSTPVEPVARDVLVTYTVTGEGVAEELGYTYGGETARFYDVELPWSVEVTVEGGSADLESVTLWTDIPGSPIRCELHVDGVLLDWDEDEWEVFCGATTWEKQIGLDLAWLYHAQDEHFREAGSYVVDFGELMASVSGIRTGVEFYGLSGDGWFTLAAVGPDGVVYTMEGAPRAERDVVVYDSLSDYRASGNSRLPVIG